jgi:hypothetical protein
VATNAAGTTQAAILNFTTAASTSSVTVTSVGVQKVVLGTGHHKKRYLVLAVGYSGGLAPAGAQNPTAYTLHAGQITVVHRVSQVTYTTPVPLVQAFYSPVTNIVALVPQGNRKLPRLEQLHVNVSIVTDPMGRPINNGKNLTATVGNTGLVISTDRIAETDRPAAAAVDTLSEKAMGFPTTRNTR